MQKLWRKTSRHRLVIACSAMGAALYCFPLQKFFTMGRYQHYGLAIGIFGMGYLLQTIWSWKVFTHWARMAYLATGIFAVTVGFTFFCNPWLDAKMAVQSNSNDLTRKILVALYLLCSLYVGAVYVRWIKEENKERAVAGRPAAAKSSAVSGTAPDKIKGDSQGEKN